MASMVSFSRNAGQLFYRISMNSVKVLQLETFVLEASMTLRRSHAFFPPQFFNQVYNKTSIPEVAGGNPHFDTCQPVWIHQKQNNA